MSKSFEPLQLLSEGLEQKIVQSTNPSIDQCATECSQEDTCCIFEYKFDVQNMVASTCKLLTDCEVEAAQYNYPIFCKKSKYRISLFFSTSTYTKDPSKFNDSKIILLWLFHNLLRLLWNQEMLLKLINIFQILHSSTILLQNWYLFWKVTK